MIKYRTSFVIVCAAWGFLTLIPSYVLPQNQAIEPELIGTISLEGSITNRANQIQIDQQGNIIILLGTDLVSYDLQQNQFTRIELGETDLINSGISQSSVFFGINNFYTGPNNTLYLVYNFDHAILTSDGELSLLPCNSFQLPEHCRIRNYAFDERGRILFTVLGGTNRAQSQKGWSIYQYDGTETTMIAGKGDVDIEPLQIGDTSVQGQDAFLRIINEMELFENTLYFLLEGKIYKITPEGFISPVTANKFNISDFTVFAEDVILANISHVDYPRFSVLFHSPTVSEPILAASIPPITKIRPPNIALAYDQNSDDLFVSAHDNISERDDTSDIVLWRIPNISRILQSNIPNWRRYDD